MVPSTASALAVVLLAIVPGFIATTTWGRSRTWKGHPSDFRSMLQSIAVSAVVQVVASPLTVAWIVPARSDLASHAARVAVWGFLVVLVIPTVLGLGAARFGDWFQGPINRATDLSQLGSFRKAWARVVKGGITPSIWDWVFEVRPPDERYVVLTFSDGSRIGGVFQAGSMAITSPEPHGIFLTTEWLLDDDGHFLSKIPGSDGIMVNTGDVRTVRVLKGQD